MQKIFLICFILFLLQIGKIFAQDSTGVDKPIENDTLKTETPIDSTQTIDSTQVTEVGGGTEDKKGKFYLVKKAYFKEGDSVFVKKIKERLAYPEEARKRKFGATLVVKFVISKEATISDIQIVEGFPEDIEADFRQLIEDKIKSAIQEVSQGAWEAAVNNLDQKVAMRKTVPITFIPYKKE
ncbi:MAG: energy transducer TonB [Raineya sp.]|nr:energy transducer TonB [Raineya sp.]